MKKLQSPFFCLSLVALIAFTLSSCTKDSNPTTATDGTDLNAATDRTPAVHRVSVGGSDICVSLPDGQSGCNGNFSLVASIDAEGNVSGQYTDQYGHGDGGFHATVTCLTVVGNQAWISGIITSGNSGGQSLVGFPIATRVLDNGQTGDLISFSWIGDDRPCTMQLNYPLFAMTGQVKVW